MRLNLVYMLMLISSIQLLGSPHGNGQNLDKIQVTVELEYGSLTALLAQIEEQTSLKFAYAHYLVSGVTVKLPKQTDTVKNILEEALSHSGLGYRVVENKSNSVVIYKRPPELKRQEFKPVKVVLTGSVTGLVTDAKTGEPLVGATVSIKGTRKGISTNTEGRYTLAGLEPGIYTVVVTFVGFERVEQEVNVMDGEVTTLNITMKETIGELGEVEINAGYYTVKDRNRTGSISRVTAEEIQDQPFTNPLEALVGRVPGVTVSATGTPGTFLSVRVRGDNSLRIPGKYVPGAPAAISSVEGGAPLYVIDGVPVQSTLINSYVHSGGLDPLANLNPENIETIEVLKDADATAIYGSRGANGVILITTKGGSAQKNDIQISVNRGIARNVSRIDVLSTEEYLQMRHEALENDGIDLEAMDPFLQSYLYPDLVFWDQDRNTDWQEELLDGASQVTDMQANFSGGSGNISYRLGGSFHREDLINKGDSYFTKAEGHLGLDYRSDDNRFRTGVTLNYGMNQQDVQGGSLTSVLWLPPNAPPLYDENGELNWAYHPVTGQNTWTNPLAALTAEQTIDNRNLVANANLGYRPIPELEFRLNLGYTENNGNENKQTPMTVTAPHNRASEGGYLQPSSQFVRTGRQGIILEPQVDYWFESGQHRLDIVIGGAYQQSENELLQLNGSQYTSDAFLGSLRGAGAVTTYDTRSEYRYLAAFSRVGYRYKERYILNLTGRRDGSSRFGPDNRFGNFGAAGAAWIFSDEPWLQQGSSVLSFGKLRGSYGLTGSDQVGEYSFLDLYQLWGTSYENTMSLVPNQLFNPDFSWEETRKLEAALELGFLDNRIMLETSWYRNRSSNQLIFRTLPFTSGFSGVLDNFSEATVQNSGWEFMVRGEPVRRADFGWSISANLSINRNKLVEFPGIEDSPYATVYQVGSPLSIQRLYTWLGVDPETGVHQFLDVDENGFITDGDRQFSDALDPDYYGGLSQQIRYKGLELDMLFQFSRGKGSYTLPGMPGTRNNQPSIVLERWQEQGDVTDIQKYSNNNLYNPHFQASQSNLYIEDQSYIRFQTLGLSYSVPQSLVSKVQIKRARLFVRAQNLLVFSRASTPDPQTGYNVPPPRMITSGLQINF